MIENKPEFEITDIVLGKGGEAVVKQGMYHGEICAVKIFDKSAPRYIDEKNKHKMYRELDIIKQIPINETLEQFLFSYETDSHMYLFLEYCGEFDIVQYITSVTITADQLQPLFTKFITPVKFLHDSGFAHRDIKLENFIISKEGKIKLVDFGYCYKTTADDLTHGYRGTIEYSCPEMIKKLDYNGFEVDVWALGVCFYAIAHNKYPFYGKSLFEIRSSILYDEPIFDCAVSETCTSVIKNMLSKNPLLRANMDDVYLSLKIEK